MIKGHQRSFKQKVQGLNPENWDNHYLLVIDSSYFFPFYLQKLMQRVGLEVDYY